MCKGNKCLIPTVIAAALGIIALVLFFIGTIPATIILTPIIYAILVASISLVLLFITAAFAIRREVRECIGNYGICITVGGIGTLITTLIALTFIASIVTGSIASAILIGLIIFFFVLTLISIVNLLLCLIRSRGPREMDNCKFQNDYKC